MKGNSSALQDLLCRNGSLAGWQGWNLTNITGIGGIAGRNLSCDLLDRQKTQGNPAVTQGIRLNRIRLNGIRLNGICLNGIRLNGIRLNGIRFNGIRLNGICLNGIRLNGIRLNGIRFNGIRLNGIRFNKVCLNGIRLNGICLSGIRLNGIRLNGIRFNKVCLNGIRLNGICLSGIRLNGIRLNGIRFNKVCLNGIRLNGIRLNGIRLLPCLMGWMVPHMDLSNWVRILLYCIIFLLSVFGNTLIIIVLVMNKRLRTVTNSFLLSLAVSDLMVALVCMPFTLIPNIIGNFIFGEVICRTAGYFMGVSVSVSTFSLVAIAIERYSAICNPLKSRVWQTRSHAYRVIAATWILSIIIMIPYLVYNVLVPFQMKAKNMTGYQCRLVWPNQEVQQAWYIFLLTVLFFIPGVVMIVAYGLISRELYRGIQFEIDLNKEAKAHKNGVATSLAPSNCDEGDGCYIQVSKRRNTMEMSTLTPCACTKMDRERINNSEAKLMAKKRVIRMLIVIVAMFFICWMPVFVANTWRAFDMPSAARALSGAPISFIHLLSYTSACVNPLIYCFMNKRFRKAFLGTFASCIKPCRRFRDPEEEACPPGASLSKFSYTTVSSLGPS
ncbi:gastrin/cholecystokinin type B receptor [Discoglossus pictus]